MKIEVMVTETKHKPKVVECSGFTMVPSWTHTGVCDYCKYDVDRKEILVVADTVVGLKRYHEKCWNQVIRWGA